MDTLFLGQHTIVLESVDSTNNYASRALQEKQLPEGSLIIAHKQDQGKGQRGSVWESNPWQNLTFSAIFYPSFLQADRQFLLSMAVSLGLVDYLNAQFPGRAQIKWPNDLLVDGVKICGILIESAVRQLVVNQAIVGIGLNVNQTEFSGRFDATSLKLETGTHHDLMGCLSSLCGHIESRYLQLRGGNVDKIRADYHTNLYRLNQWSDYLVHGVPVHALLKGVDEYGRLLLTKKNGEEVVCEVKEVTFTP